MEDLRNAIDDVIEFDGMAGHFTNPKKLVMTSVHPKHWEQLKAIIFDGIAPRITAAEVLVGDPITTTMHGPAAFDIKRHNYTPRHG